MKLKDLIVKTKEKMENKKVKGLYGIGLISIAFLIILIIDVMYIESYRFNSSDNNNDNNVVDNENNNNDGNNSDNENDNNENDNNENSNEDNNYVEEKLPSCDIANETLLRMVNELQSKTTLYKYFGKEGYFTDAIEDSYSSDNGAFCYINDENYVYVKSENKVYDFDSESKEINKDFKEYDDSLIYMYLKDVALAADMILLAEKYSDAYLGYYPLSYSGGTTFTIEVREYFGEFAEGGELYAIYTYNLKDKTFIRNDYK